MVDARYFVPTLIFVSAVVVWMVVHLYRYNQLRRAKYYLITNRFPFVAMMFGTAQILNCSMVLLYRVSTWNGKLTDVCGWGFTLDTIATSYAAPCVIVRLYLLLFTHRLQQEFVTHRRVSFSKGSESISSWSAEDTQTIRFMNHQVLRRPVFLTFKIILIGLTILVPVLVGSVTCNPELYKKFTPILVVPLLYSVILFFLMRKTNENMGIRTELKLALVLFLFRFLLKNLGPNLSTVGPFYVFELIAEILVISLFAVTIIYPQVLVKRQVKELEKDYEEMNMMTFLTDTKTGDEHFSEYLRLEFSVENLLFWKDIQLFMTKPSIAKAVRMYGLYIMSFSRLQVNIPGDVKNEIEASIERMSSDDPQYQAKFQALKKSQKKLQKGWQTSLHPPSKVPSPPPTETDSKTASDIGLEEEYSTLFDNARMSVERLMSEGAWLRFMYSDEFEHWKNGEVQIEVLNSV